MKNILQCLGQSFVDTVKHNSTECAGYVTFLLMFAIFPTMIIAIASFQIIVSYFPEISTAAQIKIDDVIREYILSDAFEAMRPHLTSLPKQKTFNFAIIGFLWTASSTIEGLKTALNRAYNAQSNRNYILRRVIGMIEFIIALISVWIINFLFTWTLGKIKYVTFLPSQTLDFFKKPLFCLEISGIISYIHIFLTNKKLSLIEVLPGSIITTILWIISGKGIKIYLIKYGNISLVYGSLEGVMLSMLFFYVSILCLMYGAEFNNNFISAKK